MPLSKASEDVQSVRNHSKPDQDAAGETYSPASLSIKSLTYQTKRKKEYFSRCASL